MSGYQKFLNDFGNLFILFWESIYLSFIFILLNVPFILFILTFKEIFHPIGIALSCALSLNLIPSFSALQYSARQNKSYLKNTIIYYKSNFKSSFKVSLTLTFVLLVLLVDAYYFKTKNNLMMEFIFTGLSLFVIVYIINSTYIISLYSGNFGDLLKTSLAYSKELTVTSLITITILSLPLILFNSIGLILFLIVFGLAAITQVFLNKEILKNLKINVQIETIKYL